MLFFFRFLATGETYASLAFAYRISPSYIGQIIKTVLNVMVKKLMPIFLPVPTEDLFRRIEQEFWQYWNFPNCIGGIDGKHVRVKCPKNSGSLFYCYKNYFSIVLLAIVDANNKFIAIDAGSYGKEGDSGIFQKSLLGRKIASNKFNIPMNKALPTTDAILPHFLIGDEAFAVNKYMMRPYSKEDAKTCSSKSIFNYRLCRARRVTENAFGLLCQIFRIFYTPIAIAPETCDDVIVVTCCLHNLLRDGYLELNRKPYHNLADGGNPTENMFPLARVGGFANASAFVIRDTLKEFFMSQAGSVSWQNDQVNRLT